MSRKKNEILEKWDRLYKDFMEEYPPHRDFKNVSEKKEFIKRQDFLLRLRRAISWFDRAKQLRQLRKENEEERKRDLDSQFIFFWISFNALYARDPHKRFEEEDKQKDESEQDRFKKYFRSLLKIDNKAHNSRIYKAIDNTKAVTKLLDNKFVDSRFWDYYHENFLERAEQKNWDTTKVIKSFDNAKKEAEPNISKMLSIIFDRLYTLRNQIMHGGSAWKVDLNRGQLRDATGIMYKLLPVFIDLMLENPETNWGKSFYPRVGGKPILYPGDL